MNYFVETCNILKMNDEEFAVMQTLLEMAADNEFNWDAFTDHGKGIIVDMYNSLQ